MPQNNRKTNTVTQRFGAFFHHQKQALLGEVLYVCCSKWPFLNFQSHHIMQNPVPNPCKKKKKKKGREKKENITFIQYLSAQKNPSHESSYPPQNAITSTSKHSSCLLPYKNIMMGALIQPEQQGKLSRQNTTTWNAQVYSPYLYNKYQRDYRDHKQPMPPATQC